MSIKVVSFLSLVMVTAVTHIAHAETHGPASVEAPRPIEPRAFTAWTVRLADVRGDNRPEPCSNPFGHCNWWFSTCNLRQHVPYANGMHGYYDSLPYHIQHIRLQQNAVLQWGGDPRNPYCNAIFRQVQAESTHDIRGSDVEELPSNTSQLRHAPAGVSAESSQRVPPRVRSGAEMTIRFGPG